MPSENKPVCRSSLLVVSLVCLGASLCVTAGRADDLRVLPAQPAKTPSALYQRLLAQAEVAVDARQKAFEQVQTPEQVRAWQRNKRDIFLRQIGPFPRRTPLSSQVTGKLKGEGYRVEKVTYESRPGHHVTALLYLPDGKPPYPGVLVPCGHSFNGKAAEGYQRVSILLAQNGLAALCYDPIGQGERYQTFADGKALGADYTGSPSSVKRLAELPGQPRFNPVEEHTLIGIGSILVGTNTANYRIWDGIRSIDYLASRPDIDPKRIGCTGNSGGGTLTAYLMALDDRIACAAPACSLTSFRRLLQTAGPQDAEQNLFGQLALGLDEADLMHMRAPKPTVILAGTRDATFDIAGTWDLFREAKRFYARLDHPERVDLVEADAPHGFTVQLRVGSVRWMRRWLLGRDDAITEPELTVRSDEELWCTPKGQVMFLKGERSVFDLNREREAELARERALFWKKTSRQEAITKVGDIVGKRRLKDLPALQHRLAGTVKRDGYVIEKLVLEGEAGVQLPALAFLPPEPREDTYLYLNGAGKEADASAGGVIEKLVRGGHIVLAVDLQGTGETDRRHPRDWGRSLFGPLTQEYFLAYLLEKSLVGVWTEDAIGCGRFLSAYRAKVGARKVHLIGVGTAGVPALHAAALEPLFASLTLHRTLESWSSVMRAPVAGSQLPLAVHGALETYDLPDLVRSLGEKVKILEPVGPEGKAIRPGH